jgi:hypothetical protein
LLAVSQPPDAWRNAFAGIDQVDFLNELLVIRAASLVGGHSLFMDFGDGVAPPIRIDATFVAAS